MYASIKGWPLLVALALLIAPYAYADLDQRQAVIIESATAIERQLAARVGIAILDTESGELSGYRANERFPLLSTFKTLACANLLARAEAGTVALTDRITFTRQELVTYSPVTKRFADGPGMTLEDLCTATMTTSDNTAANLVLRALGGPSALTAFLREVGDERTRLDRWETELNSAIAGDPRDTTTPATMVATLHRLLLGDVLGETARSQLQIWMRDNQTADQLLRPALPAGWQIGDRTGAGENGARVITAILWPPNKRPFIIAIYITETTATFRARNAAIAALGAALLGALAP